MVHAEGGDAVALLPEDGVEVEAGHVTERRQVEQGRTDLILQGLAAALTRFPL